MKKSALSPLLALALAGAAFADAIVFPDESVNVDYYVYVTTPDGGLNLREGPGVDYSIITTIPDYELLHVTVEKGNGWGYVQYGDNYGWVYLGQTSPDLLSLGTAADYYVYVVSPDGRLNLRLGPNTRCNILTSIEYGSRIHISRECAGWGLTSFDGYSGWVYLGETSGTLPNPTQTPAPATESLAPTRPAASPTPSPDSSPSPGLTEQPQTGVKIQFQNDEDEATPVPENNSALSTSTIIITALCAIIIILAALVIYFVLRRRP